jgi:serine protease Do
MRHVRQSVPFIVLLAVLAAIFYAPTLVERVSYAIAAGETKALRDQLPELSKQDQMSGLFSAVARAVQPAVVVVNVRQKMTMQTPAIPDMDDFLRRFFGDEEQFGPAPRRRVPAPAPQPREYFARGLGSGVVVDAEKGYVLTNWHVVQGAEDVEVVLSDDRKAKAEWVRTDPQTDLAIIKIATDHLTAAPLGDSDKIEVGHWVLAIGAPRGLSKTVTAGIISAKGRTTGRAGYESFLQTDAAINQGNSGGPLVNMRGEVIGINSSIVTHFGGNEGIGFAIPSNMVKYVMSQLIEKGKVTRGYLGVTIQNADEALAKSFNLPNTDGALVSGVMEASPAAKAKLKEGDFIVSVDGHDVRNVNELRNEVATIEPGKKVAVMYYRDGKKQSAEIAIEIQPKEMAAGETVEKPPQSTKADKFGLKVADLTKDLAQQYGYPAPKEGAKGAMITEVNPLSDAADEGLKAGQVILQAGDKAVGSADDLEKALAAHETGDGIRLLVTDPSGGKRFVVIKPGK